MAVASSWRVEEFWWVRRKKLLEIRAKTRVTRGVCAIFAVLAVPRVSLIMHPTIGCPDPERRTFSFTEFRLAAHLRRKVMFDY